ncbi:MAG: hypothetical protein HOH19_03450, partial [Kordiimonadaceae bacterium]|nr:hypothetical protein [Kordiimonadaceae bacterium]
QTASEGKAGKISRISGSDGKTYFMGELINRPLLSDEMSVWGLVGGKAQQLGTQKLPDINEIVQHVAGTVGGEEFGIPRLEEKHQLRKLPTEYINEFHSQLVNIIIKYTKLPVEFPIIVGLAIQHLMDDAKDVIDPGMAATIVMECAVPMSKVETSGMLKIT